MASSSLGEVHFMLLMRSAPLLLEGPLPPTGSPPPLVVVGVVVVVVVMVVVTPVSSWVVVEFAAVLGCRGQGRWGGGRQRELLLLDQRGGVPAGRQASARAGALAGLQVVGRLRAAWR